MTTDPSYQKRLGPLLYYGIIILLTYLVYLVFAPFLVPLAWAAVLVVVTYPVYERLCMRCGCTTAAALTVAGVTLIIIVPMIFVSAAFVRQGVDAVHSFQAQLSAGHFSWTEHFWARVQRIFPDADDLPTSLRQYGEVAAGYVGARLGTILRNTAGFIFDLGVTIFAMFYLYRDGSSMVTRLREILPFERSHRDRMILTARDLIFASVTSTLVVALVQGTLGGLIFALVGIHTPVFWAVMIAFFSFIPVVGSALVWVPFSISLMASGHMGRGIILAAFCGLFVSLIDTIIRPWLISGRAEIGGLVMFISVLGGISVFGLLGVVLGPIIVATALRLLDIYSPAQESASSEMGRKSAAC